MKRLIQYFIPQSLPLDEEVQRKARLTVGTLIIITYFNLNYILFSWFIDFSGGLISQVPLFILGLITLALYRAGVNRATILSTYFIFCSICIGAVVFYTGGFSSKLLAWLASTPIVALLVWSKRGSIVSLVTVLILEFVFFYLEQSGFEFPNQINPEVATVFFVACNIGLVLILFWIGYVFENAKDRAVNNLEAKNEELGIALKEIHDSIIYAKRIQNAILPPNSLVNQHLKNSFVLYKPKDVVAGDFYWLEPQGDTVYFAAADCTGHGVPGALVSVICNNGLNRSVREFGLRKPGEILDKTRELVIKEFEKSEEEVRDGMDISLCALNTKTYQLQWAGANNPLWIVRKSADEIEEIKADKQPIGKYDLAKLFTTHMVQLEEGDTIYLFSDGYADQFGGERGKKYKSGKFKRSLVDLAQSPISQQKQLLDNQFETWRGKIEQVDDICVIGVEIA